MSDQALPNSPVNLSVNPLWIALFAAVIVHIVVMFSVQVSKPEPEHFSKSIDITLVNAPTTQAPEKAQFLAEENQLGGQQTNKPEPAKQAVPEQEKPTPKPQPEKIKPTPPANPIPKTPPAPKEKPTPKAPPEKIKPVAKEKPIPKVPPEKIKPVSPEKPIQKVQAEKVEPIKPVPKEKPIEKRVPDAAEQKIIAQQKAEWNMMTQDTAEQKTETRKHSTIDSQSQQHHALSAASLQQQIAEMGTEIRQKPASTTPTKTKYVNQVSANKYVAAQYLKDWEAKVERTGNNNYPAAASKPGFSATLTMDVFIKADGSIDAMRITQSSGIPELDEQAKNIVRMSAPFPPLPSKLRSELDVLVITRSWKFSDESGLITQ
ncbi:MAG: periplasmic protein TonB [Methylococcaceae bacterium NSP1-2]|nr:TonB family protein [Methylococcaceae bacterium]OYV19109.1 MAG: periplasmic protein TonB [Methylococcaceae bacterium NSP1-2]